MTTTKKTAAKKAPAKKAAANPDPLAVVREDTPNPELTDLDADPACVYCGRTATARLVPRGSLVCDSHKKRAQALEQGLEEL